MLLLRSLIKIINRVPSYCTIFYLLLLGLGRGCWLDVLLLRLVGLFLLLRLGGLALFALRLARLQYNAAF